MLQSLHAEVSSSLFISSTEVFQVGEGIIRKFIYMWKYK